VRKLDIYLLPHSHVDIGYTALQSDVVQKQNENIETGLRLAQATADYPEGSRFKWNVEVLWPWKLLAQRFARKTRGIHRGGQIGSVGLDALYGNILTGSAGRRN